MARGGCACAARRAAPATPRSDWRPPGRWPSRPCVEPTRGARFLVRREVRVPLAERPERAPELPLGVLLVERAVDVGHVQGVAGGCEALDLTRPRVDLPAERHAEAVQLLERLIANHHDDARLHDRELLEHAR